METEVVAVTAQHGVLEHHLGSVNKVANPT